MTDDNDDIQNASQWLGDHGMPTEEHLRELVEEATPDALEELHELAEEYDIEDTGGDPADLVDRILLAMEQETGDDALGNELI